MMFVEVVLPKTLAADPDGMVPIFALNSHAKQRQPLLPANFEFAARDGGILICLCLWILGIPDVRIGAPMNVGD